MAAPGFRHIGLKMLSIGLASLLWLLVAGEQIAERALRIPVEFSNVPQSLEIVGDPDRTVDVRVRGSAGALARVAPGELVAVVDLALGREGQRLFPVTSENVRTPFGVEVVQVTPSSISIRLERSIVKVVPVIPSIEGEPLQGYVIGTVRAEPATVPVVGAESALADVTEAITEPVNVQGKAAPFIETVTVGAPTPDVRLQSPQVARVSVSITAAPVEWTVVGVPIQIRNASRAVSVRPREVTLAVRGPEDAGGASPSDFDAYVDVQGLGTGEFDRVVSVEPPPRVGVVRIQPELVRVTIR